MLPLQNLGSLFSQRISIWIVPWTQIWPRAQSPSSRPVQFPLFWSASASPQLPCFLCSFGSIQIEFVDVCLFLLTTTKKESEPEALQGETSWNSAGSKSGVEPKVSFSHLGNYWCLMLWLLSLSRSKCYAVVHWPCAGPKIWNASIQGRFFPTSLWGFCFLACIPPAVVRRRPPSSAAALSHTHITKLISSYTSHVTSYTTHPTSHTTHLTHNSSHTTLISHTHITKLISYNLIHNSSHTPHLIHHITHHSSHTHTHHKTYLIIHKSFHIIHNSSHTQLILHTTHLTDSAWQAQYAELPEEGVARIVAAVAAARCCVAGAVHRAFCRSWGADCRRLGRAFSVRGRRNTQSLLKELRRGLSPAGPRRSFAWQAQYTEPPEGAAARIVAGWAAASLCLAGTVHRAFWRSCGADCRRLGRGFSLRGRRSTQRLLKEVGRGLSPAGPRLLSAWQAQYTEPSEGAAARTVAGWAAALLCVAGAVHRASWRSWGADCRRLGRAFSLRGRRSTQSLLKELRRGLSPAGPRPSFAWQAQYTEPPEGVAARIVAGWAAALCCVAGAVHRASFRSWVADCRRLGRGFFCVAGAVHRAFWRSCGADCRRLGRGFSLRGRRSTQSLLKELRRGLSPAGPRLAVAAIILGRGVCATDLCCRSYIGVCRGGVCLTDMSRRSYIGVCRGGVSVTDLCRHSYIGVCRGSVCASDLGRRSYIGVCRGGVSVTDLCRHSYIGVSRGCLCDRSVLPQLYRQLQRGVSATDLRRRSHIGVSHTIHLTPLIPHHSSHTPHLTQLISHHSSHTAHLTPLIPHH